MNNAKNDTKNKNKDIPSITEFSQLLYLHDSSGWSYIKDNFQEYMSALRTENRLYNIALFAGPAYVREYSWHQKLGMYRFRDEAVGKLINEHYAHLKEIVKTGDEEFDNYAARVRNHDWFWTYSDDGGVARSASANEDELIKISKEKGGMYITYWNHIAKTIGKRTKG